MSVFTVDELKLAFGYHIVRLIIGADARLELTEIDFLQRHFPREIVAGAGFVDQSGDFTPRHRDAMREALSVLPDVLSLDEKLAFLTIFVQATLSDDTFAPDEGGIVEQAAGMLGVSSGDLDRHLEAMPEVGAVDLPDPEPEG